MKQILIRKVPEELHRAFKTLCAKQGVSMQDEIMLLMRKELERQTMLEQRRKGKR